MQLYTKVVKENITINLVNSRIKDLTHGILSFFHCLVKSQLNLKLF